MEIASASANAREYKTVLPRSTNTTKTHVYVGIYYVLQYCIVEKIRFTKWLQRARAMKNHKSLVGPDCRAGGARIP